MPQCRFCLQAFSTGSNVRRHQQQTNTCREGLARQLKATLRHQNGVTETVKKDNMTAFSPLNDLPYNDDLPLSLDIDALASASDDNVSNDVDALPPSLTTDVDSRNRPKTYWEQSFPDAYAAGQTFGTGKPLFQTIRDDQISQGADVLGPFKDDAEWDLAKWLIKNVGHNQAEEFLNLQIITERAQLSYKNKNQFIDKIDSLTGGTSWSCVEINAKGDLPDIEKDPTGQTMRHETVELWFRDPVECVKELVANPAFQETMSYAPEKIFADAEGKMRVINEMNTGDWWWEIQKRLPPGATVAPIILSSDKTHLSNFRGDQSAWPLYLTIGNIAKDVRREVSAHATILIGYLPIPKFDCFSKDARSLAKYRLFHMCMGLVLKSLVEAGKTGKQMVCADGFIRNIWPILASYVADYPEQCLVACCMENRCPKCPIDPNCRGKHQIEPGRTVQDTLFWLRRKAEGENDTAFKVLGLRDVYPPFWSTLPHCDIFLSFTPDLLHQLHKGVFKDHVVKWCTEIIGKEEVDLRFRTMPDHPDLRHFKNGISHVSQWTGAEHKEMERVFLALVAKGVDERVVRAVRGIIDFAYFASLQSHTSDSLLGLRRSLDLFHENKQAFIDLHGRTQDHFNIPKLHSLEHYEDMIRLFGSADGYNTESPERLHIDFAKKGYRASNRKDYIIQMTRWLERQENVDRFTAFLKWARQIPVSSTVQTDPNDLLMTRTTAFRVARRPPPTSRRTLASHIISPDGHNAACFLDALKTYIQNEFHTSFVPHVFDVFPLWKRLIFELPSLPEVGSRHNKNIVRAIGPTPQYQGPGRHTVPEPAHLDHALIRTGEINEFTRGTALEGLRVAQVHAIFQLPTHYPVKSSIPLAYVEWFTPLRTPDPVTG
ncbi:hypothetical protein H0H93_000646 [Arthromyces matolae]|nr:hypothetical protein H0H93_000646 [Arthromyces matolae]